MSHIFSFYVLFIYNKSIFYPLTSAVNNIQTTPNLFNIIIMYI